MGSIIKTAEFVKSSAKLGQCPEAEKPEYAFIGRSNVGKSSLINMMTGVGGLAKTSSTPGKTQLINHYVINDKWYLVDLPGMGYAKTSKTIREKFNKMVKGYLAGRKTLLNTFVLLDIRHEPQKIDLEFMAWMAENELPFVMVFTKSDKLSKGKLEMNIAQYKREMKKLWEELPPILITSSKSGWGRSEILALIEATNQMYFSATE